MHAPSAGEIRDPRRCMVFLLALSRVPHPSALLWLLHTPLALIARHLWDCSSLISKQHLPSKVINDDRHSSRIVPVSLEKGRGIATWRRWASRSTIGLGLELGTAEAQPAYDQVRSG
ncbi:hypothetical protein BHE74_00031571 [Ensete ventricosum]|nr:hypothetical protein BHE74_00031571 [Ensete ventricosum]